MRCEWCAGQVVVTVNGRRACTEHIDDAMKAVLEPLKIALHPCTSPNRLPSMHCCGRGKVT